MLKGLVQKLFGGGAAASSPEGLFLNVRCKACSEEFRLFINKSTDLTQNFGEAGGVSYSLNKEIVGGLCRNLIHVNMRFDGQKRLLSREIENGEFIEES